MSRKHTGKKAGFGAAPVVSKFKRATTAVGEDLPALKRIAKEIKGQNITIEDYIVLVGPHTGDKGAALTKVMNEDLTAFRKMVTRVYDTMTKDASDVMANTQIELGQLYSEKQRELVDNMLRSLQTIKDYVPDFDFQQYFQDPEKYLCSLFRLADIPDDDEIEAARRQLAYHRLQWLQSEGERLQAENSKLEERLTELKKVKRRQITEALTKEQEADRKRIELEQKQEEMQNELEELCDELHETIITEEKKSMNMKKEKSIKILAKKPKTVASAPTREEKQKAWNVKVATEYSKAQIHGETLTNMGAAGASGISRRSRPGSASSGSGSAPRQTRVKKKIKKPVPIHARPAWQDVKLDELPADDGGRGATREEQMPIDLLSVGTSRAQAARQATACPPTCSNSPAARAAPTGRRIAGPADTWRGFT